MLSRMVRTMTDRTMGELLAYIHFQRMEAAKANFDGGGESEAVYHLLDVHNALGEFLASSRFDDKRKLLQQMRLLHGALSDHELDIEPPVSEYEEGVLEGLGMAKEEINEVIDDIQQ